MTDVVVMVAVSGKGGHKTAALIMKLMSYTGLHVHVQNTRQLAFPVVRAVQGTVVCLYGTCKQGLEPTL